jgi:GT2 family glycosyltransferase
VDICVDAIREKGEECRIIVIDDGLERRREDCAYVSGIKPFVYSRAINQGIKAAGSNDVILLNDDATLLTEKGLSALWWECERNEKIGLLSAAVDGTVCNPNQEPKGSKKLRREHTIVAFICVYIPRRTIDQVGLLDERYIGYGEDDRDYCKRVLMAGLQLQISDGCVVDHSDESRCSFRTQEDYDEIYGVNRRLYLEKWRNVQRIVSDPFINRSHQMADKDAVDLLYVACNRLVFTQASFDNLIEVTNWRAVRKLFVYDDGSMDGTGEWLKGAARRAADQGLAETDFISSGFGSPIGVMRDFIERADAPLLCKIDNDCMMPPGWLDVALEAMNNNPTLDLLGLEAFEGCDPNMETPRSFSPTKNIGGVGLFRAEAFSYEKPTIDPTDKYAGFWHWQSKAKDTQKGWLKPGIPMFLLDRLPFDPWKIHTAEYEASDWQRPWWRYDIEKHSSLWAWKFPEEVPVVPI